jgi:DNA-binding transcriptional ArsR family regulator
VPLTADIYKALASDVRLKIVALLEKGQQPLNEIAEAAEIEPQTALFHLRLLEEAGLVSSIFEEGRRYYVLESRDILERLILREKPPKPPKHKPPHEIVEERFEIIDRKLDEITQMVKKISGEIEQLKKTREKEAG